MALWLINWSVYKYFIMESFHHCVKSYCIVLCSVLIWLVTSIYKYVNSHWTVYLIFFSFHTKRYSTLLIITEIQIKTTLMYQLIPVRMAIIKKFKNNKCWRGCGQKGTFLHCWWECKLVQSLWKIVWKFLRKLKVELSCNQQSHSWAYIQTNL